MPPKKKGGGNQPSKKTEQKQKQKIIEDKTFGLKNKKKSAKVQKYVSSVEAQVNASGNRKQLQAEEARKKALAEKKKAAEEKKKEKSEMERNLLPAKKVPLEAAIEPAEDEELNMNKLSLDDDNITLEEWIDKQKSNMGEGLTPVTEETFAAWKRKRNEQKAADAAKRRKRIEAGKETQALSGRELFEYQSNLIQQEYDIEEDDEVYDLGEFGVNEDILDEELFEGEDLDDLVVDDDSEDGRMEGTSQRNGRS